MKTEKEIKKRLSALSTNYSLVVKVNGGDPNTHGCKIVLTMINELCWVLDIKKRPIKK